MYLKLSDKTIISHDLPARNLVISATEIVPRNWDTPVASVYNPDEDGSSIKLGDVTEVSSAD